MPFHRASLALLPLLPAFAFAQDTAPPARPLWEIGAVALGVSQQAYPGSDRQIQRGLALPYLIYRGRFLRADNDGIGVRPVRTPTFEFDVSAAGAFGSRARDDPARRGLRDLGTLVEFGPRLRWNLGGDARTGRWRVDLPLRGVFDLNDSLAYRGVVFQPGLYWQRRAAGGWTYGAGASLLIADRRLSATFYEVPAAAATAARPAYTARAGLLGTRVSASVAKDLTPDWAVFGFARLDSVAGAANRASPLVRQVTGHTVGIGVSWTWLRSNEPASD